MKAEAKVACACCGRLTLSARGDYEVCPHCGWEDDPAQAAVPDSPGGPNGVTLRQAQRNYALFGASERRLIGRARSTDAPLDPGFVPLTLSTEDAERWGARLAELLLDLREDLQTGRFAEYVQALVGFRASVEWLYRQATHPEVNTPRFVDFTLPIEYDAMWEWFENQVYNWVGVTDGLEDD